MPWKGSTIMDLRKEFVRFALLPNANISELCKRYGISRPTAYKWVKRFYEQGDVGLCDRSKEPLTQPRKTSSDIEQLI